MIWLYRLLFLPALVVLLPWFLWRTRGRGGWRGNWGNRLGRYGEVPPRRAGVPRIWIQAVSVGELLAVVPLVQALRREGIEIVLTTTTTTGMALAQERLAGEVAALGFFPVDFWPFSARAWAELQPDLAVLAEGERWPEHIHQGARRGTPVISVNARLSPRGFARARRVRWFVLPLWRRLTRVLAGTEADQQRFLDLGFDPRQVGFTGNMKLDVDVPRLSPEQREALRRETGLHDGLVVVGASTWPGEEAVLLDWLERARNAGQPLHLLLVPRHVERRADLALLLADRRWSHHFRSNGAAPSPTDVLVADTTGELRQLLQLGDLIFVGRSLPPYAEGQTPLEAAILGLPLCFGPGMVNFQELVDGMLAVGAARQVADAAELMTVGDTLLRDPAARASLGSAAARWAMVNRGAVERTVTEIRRLLSEPPGAQGAQLVSEA